MQLTVKLLGHLLDDVADAGVGFSGADYTVEKALTIPELAARVGLTADAEFFVMVNETHVPNDEWPTHQLADGDEVVFCPPLKGG